MYHFKSMPIMHVLISENEDTKLHEPFVVGYLLEALLES